MDFQQANKQQQKQSFVHDSLFKTQEELQNDFILKPGEESINRTYSESSLNETAEMLINENATEFKLESKVKEEEPQEQKKEAPAEPQYIGLERCFTAKQDDDSDRMLALRDAIQRYHDAKDEGKNKNKFNELKALKNIVKACKKYRFMRFSFFRREKGKARLNQVAALQEKVTAMVEEMQEHVDAHNEDYIHNDKEFERGVMIANKLHTGTNLAQKIASGFIAGVSFLVYNPIRLAGAAVMAPFWAINEGVRAVERKVTGGWAHRPIKMGWRWTPRNLYFDSLRMFYHINTQYTSVGTTVLNADYLKTPKDLEKFKKIPGVKVDTKKGTVEIEENGEKTKYRVSFDEKYGTGINAWYRIIKEKDPKTGKMKTTEVRVAENETISVEEFVKIGKKKVSKNYDLEKAEMDAIRAELNGEEDDLYDYEEDEEEEKEGVVEEEEEYELKRSKQVDEDLAEKVVEEVNEGEDYKLKRSKPVSEKAAKKAVKDAKKTLKEEKKKQKKTSGSKK